nr:PEGA domain-containing protein [Bacteroidota bacterium]
MKHIYFITFLLISQLAMADSLDVTGFKQIPNDISSSRYPRLDANDNTCALIKVLSALDGLGFESNVGIVGNIEKKAGTSENLDNFKEITITSKPTGANLSLNGKSEGTTPQTLTTNFGKNTIQLTKKGYNDLQETITVTDQQDTHTFTMIPDQKTIAQLDFNKYKRRKNWWLTGTIVSGAIGGYFLYSAEKHYNDYKTAGDDATDLHDKIEKEDIIWPVAFGVSGICAVFTTINLSKQNRAKKRLNISLAPIDHGGLLSLKMNF